MIRYESQAAPYKSPHLPYYKVGRIKFLLLISNFLLAMRSCRDNVYKHPSVPLVSTQHYNALHTLREWAPQGNEWAMSD